MRPVVGVGDGRVSAAVPGSARASRRNGMMPRSSRASRQASLARATSALSSPGAPAWSEDELLRRAVSSSPTAATRMAAAVTAPKTHPVVSRVWANASSG